MAWILRPPQNNFDGNPLKNAIREDMALRLTAAGKLRTEGAAERKARLQAARAAAETDPNAELWNDRANQYAARCCDFLGSAVNDLAAALQGELETLTWRQIAEGFERVADRSRYFVPPTNTLKDIFYNRL